MLHRAPPNWRLAMDESRIFAFVRECQAFAGRSGRHYCRERLQRALHSFAGAIPPEAGHAQQLCIAQILETLSEGLARHLHANVHREYADDMDACDFNAAAVAHEEWIAARGMSPNLAFLRSTEKFMDSPRGGASHSGVGQGGAAHQTTFRRGPLRISAGARRRLPPDPIATGLQAAVRCDDPRVPDAVPAPASGRAAEAYECSHRGYHGAGGIRMPGSFLSRVRSGVAHDASEIPSPFRNTRLSSGPPRRRPR